MQTQYDLAIVGGGLVGASLACALQPLGLRVALIEAVSYRSDTQPSYDERMLSLALGSQRIFEGMGIWSKIESQGVIPIRAVHVSDQGHIGKTRLKAEEFGLSAMGYIVPARAIGASLVSTLTQIEHLDLHCPSTVVGINKTDSDVELTVKTEDEQIFIRSRLVVLADGGTSKTRALLGIRVSEKDYRQTAVLSTVTSELPHGNTAYERFTATGPLALLPATQQRCAVVWTSLNNQVEEILNFSDDEYLLGLQQRFGDWLGQLSSPAKRKAYPLRLVKVAESIQPRVIVMGNAAHALHPVAGQGFNLGLRDVATLADVLSQAVAQNQDIASMSMMENYQRWRQRDTTNTSKFTDSLISIFANDWLPKVVGRNLGLTALNHLPFAKKLLLRRTMGLNGRLPRLSRGLSLVP